MDISCDDAEEGGAGKDLRGTCVCGVFPSHVKGKGCFRDHSLHFAPRLTPVKDVCLDICH